jgi:hypothetical protein
MPCDNTISPCDIDANWQPNSQYIVDGEGTRPTINADGYDYIIVGSKLVQKDALPAFAESLYETNERVKSSIQSHLLQMLDTSPFLSDWKELGVEKPSEKCRERSILLATQLLEEHKILPIRVAYSIEEGIMLVYRNDGNGKSLMLETYNTLEVAGLVKQEKRHLDCIDVKNTKDLNKLAWLFLE